MDGLFDKMKGRHTRSQSLDSKHSRQSDVMYSQERDMPDRPMSPETVKTENQEQKEQQVLLDMMEDISKLIIDKGKTKKDTLQMASEYRNVEKMQDDFNQMKSDLEKLKVVIKKTQEAEHLNSIPVDPPTAFSPTNILDQNHALRESVQKTFPSFTTNKDDTFLFQAAYTLKE